ncbi:MoeB/ThiF family adenylyltransferase [Thalassobacillus pellis]|uniref:MoeB/ThiF family adenylyltransferase n=1 Tax=Thalassobacillus pellis TaxID=748008 RepID=UPI0019601D3C|nr:MoeB/ThiF family adenylyltransferase [Thalassobacillus pellis]MBM7553796.1 molybdopterin/thiamine biosynthesis adenylyltransferase [Thalassobacillus pellis]
MKDDRYSRQVLFSPIGKEGQEQLEAKHVLIIGAGALGTSNAEQLARAGVGKMTIVDRDYVEFSNLQRQQLFSEKDAENRMPKAVAAKERLSAINSGISIFSHVMDVQVEELEKLAPDADVIIDATDNFDTRLLINDISQKHDKPWVYGGCVGSYGLTYTIVPGKTPCLNCLLETVPIGGATCDTAGIISPAVQMVTAHQVAEVLKILVGDEQALHGKLISFDMWNHHYQAIKVNTVKNPECRSCGGNRDYPYLSPESQTKTAVLCGRDTVQIRPPERMERDFDTLRRRLHDGEIKQNPFLLSYTLNDHRMVFFKDGRVLVHGTKDIAEARRLYYKIVG